MSQQDPHAPYTVYKMDVSYFSGKLEAYLRYKGIPHQSIEADARCLDGVIYRHTGVKKVPAVRTADNQWLFDSTPTILWFEEHYTAAPVLPPDPALAFLVRLIEDYADEWLWRPAMWWRWVPRASSLALGRRIADNTRVPGVPRSFMAWFFPRRQRQTWLWGDGVDGGNEATVRDLYLRELEFLQPLLQAQPFLLGSHPSLADFGYFASMFRHFGNDPDPAELMRREAPAVYAWTARLWDSSADRLGAKQQWIWPEGAPWEGLWERILGDYLPYLRQNALAFSRRQRRFDFAGRSISFRGTVTHQYRVWCRQQLQRAWAALAAPARQRVVELLAPYGGLDALEADGEIDAGVGDRYALPRAPGHFRPSLAISLFGQPRD